MNYISNQNISLSGTSDDYMRSFRPSKLCSDLAFWKHRCLNDSQEALQYVEAKRCSTYETRSIRNETCLPNQIYCSNKNTCLTNINECEGHFYFGNETQCKNLNMYHCPESNQCIWQDWVCVAMDSSNVLKAMMRTLMFATIEEALLKERQSNVMRPNDTHTISPSWQQNVIILLNAKTKKMRRIAKLMSRKFQLPWEFSLL